MEKHQTHHTPSTTGEKTMQCKDMWISGPLLHNKGLLIQWAISGKKPCSSGAPPPQHGPYSPHWNEPQWKKPCSSGPHHQRMTHSPLWNEPQWKKPCITVPRPSFTTRDYSSSIPSVEKTMHYSSGASPPEDDSFSPVGSK